ncbi:MAG: homoserine kinase [Terriglobia bacterium]
MILKKTIRVPASTTNLGAGFDALGLALQLYLSVGVESSKEPHPAFTIEGEGAGQIPTGSENLIAKVMQRVFAGEGMSCPPLRFHVVNQIPLARGLGSSAAAIVAGISCFEAVTGRELSSEKFFRYAFEFENHPDNLTAARYGGFTVSCVGKGEQVTYSRSALLDPLELLLIVPEFHLETEKARAALPPTLTLRDAVFNIQRSALTVAAILKKDFSLLKEGLLDRVHQPYRAPLIPGFQEVLALNEEVVPGMIAVCLSGAGPSVLAFAEDHHEDLYARIAQIFQKRGIRCRRFDLQVDNQGRVIS